MQIWSTSSIGFDVGADEEISLTALNFSSSTGFEVAWLFLLNFDDDRVVMELVDLKVKHEMESARSGGCGGERGRLPRNGSWDEKG